MKKRRTRLKLMTQRSVALLLLVYLSGAACMFGCEMGSCPTPEPVAAASPPEVESCEMGQGHDCCQTKQASAPAPANVTQPPRPVPPTPECCPLNNRAPYDATQKVSLEQPAMAVEHHPWRYAARHRLTLPPRVDYQLPRPPNLPRIYLLDCVFLI